MGKWTDVIKKELDSIFINHDNQSFEQDGNIISFSYQSVRVAGEEVLRASMSIQNRLIEDPWRKFLSELLLNEKLNYPTIYVSIRNLGLANNVLKDGLVLDGFSDKEIIHLIRRTFIDVFPERIKHYSSLENCNNLINKHIEIQEGIGQVTSLEGLPFRKVLLAEAVNDPRSREIKEAMRFYCETNYELGKRENFEQLCRLKLVFERMFPKN